ncbi:MAG: hypothetical protein LBL73_01705 [Synergistaceae bacterium]|jgi:hypothetical protein|nr:hypothetical protein [Synergistaceae bacterium]
MERVSISEAVKGHPRLSVLLAAATGMALGVCGAFAPGRLASASTSHLGALIKLALSFILRP